MKLVIALPPEHAANVRVLEPTLDDPQVWIAGMLGAGSATTRALTTRRGWPMQVIWGPAAVIAVYTLWDLTAAVAIAGARDIDDATLEALRSVEPDWKSDEPLVVDELWTAPLGLP